MSIRRRRALLAECRKDLAFLLMDLGKSAQAMAATKLARMDQEKLAAAPGASDEARRNLAETVNLIGFHLWRRGKPAEAVPEFRTALAIYQRVDCATTRLSPSSAEVYRRATFILATF